jgi:hypothetical protein
MICRVVLQNEETARWNRRVIAARALKRRRQDQQKRAQGRNGSALYRSQLTLSIACGKLIL